MLKLSTDQVRLLRLHSQGLSNQSSFDDTEAAIRHLCGLQSQELPSAYLAIRARTKNLTLEDVKKAREIDRSIVLTWLMRGTLHLALTDDVLWLGSLLGSHFIRQTESRYQQLGLSLEIRQNASELIQEILSKSPPISRAELTQNLVPYGIPIEGQAFHHLVRYAALSGIVCLATENDGRLSYVRIDEWLQSYSSKNFSPEQALSEIARRYLQAYAPATVYDFASWSGLPMSQIKTGFKQISNELIEVKTPSEVAWILNEQVEYIDTLSESGEVRLLPRYDNYLLGHKSRDFMVEPVHAKQVHPGGGLIRTCVIVDGQAKANWRLEQKKDHIKIMVQPYSQSEKLPEDNLEAEVADIGRFLSTEAILEIE